MRGDNFRKYDRPNGKCVSCGEPWNKTSHRRCYKCQEKRRKERFAQEKECRYCGKLFQRNPRGRSLWCSYKCYSEWKFNQRVKFCPVCNQPIKGRFTYRRAACSKKCAWVLRRQNSPLITEKRYRYFKSEREWKDTCAIIHNRDSRRCVVCSSRSAPQVDHFFPFRLVRSWGFNPNDHQNLNCLCRKHHAVKTHLEQKLLAGDWLSFISGLRAMNFPTERIEKVCKLYQVGQWNG